MKKVNIMIGRFQPLTNGHMKCVELAYSELGVPTIICMINTTDAKVDKKHPFPSDLLLPIYNEVFEKSHMVESVELVRNANIVEIGKTLFEKGYEIVSWTCGTDRIDSYTKMSTKYAEESHLSKDFKMIEIKRSDEDISATKVRLAILDDDYKTYAKLTPLVPLRAKLKGDENYSKLREQLLNVYK